MAASAAAAARSQPPHHRPCSSCAVPPLSLLTRSSLWSHTPCDPPGWQEADGRVNPSFPVFSVDEREADSTEARVREALEGLRRGFPSSFQFSGQRSPPPERAWCGPEMVAGLCDLHCGSPRCPTNVTVLNSSLANDSFSVTFHLGFLLHFPRIPCLSFSSSSFCSCEVKQCEAGTRVELHRLTWTW
ncbi:hypothetical protein E2C01_095221 [Portunus trituberculatus]|uniref:Uncharacterized protein n=1 Tax=Portunus trituberculatus TaxID=210409 RepID=A0A5B7K571_PORTR|nr:hypothetical protein [Portunus trituberculatus]